MQMSPITVAIIVAAMFSVVFVLPVLKRRRDIQRLSQFSKQNGWELVQRDYGFEIAPERNDDWYVYFKKESPTPQSYRERIYWISNLIQIQTSLIVVPKISSSFLADLILRALMMENPESYDREMTMFSLNSKEFDSKYTCWTSDERIARNFLDEEMQQLLIAYFSKNIQLICFTKSIEIRQTKPLQITMIPDLIKYGSTILELKKT